MAELFCWELATEARRFRSGVNYGIKEVAERRAKPQTEAAPRADR